MTALKSLDSSSFLRSTATVLDVDVGLALSLVAGHYALRVELSHSHVAGRQ